LGALAAQLLHACADHGEIVGGAGSGHVSSVSCDSDVITRPRRFTDLLYALINLAIKDAIARKESSCRKCFPWTAS
jgi:hypothetical protein